MAKIKLIEEEAKSNLVLGTLSRGQIKSALATTESTHQQLFPESWQTPHRWSYELGTRFVMWLNIPEPLECAKVTAWIRDHHSWTPLIHRGFYKGHRQVLLRPDLTPMELPD